MFCALMRKQATWSEVWWRLPRICGCFCLYFSLSFLDMVMLSVIWVKPNLLIQKKELCQKKKMCQNANKKKKNLNISKLENTMRKLFSTGFFWLRAMTGMKCQYLQLSLPSVHIFYWLLSWWIFWSRSWAAHLREWEEVKSSTPLKKKWAL